MEPNLQHVLSVVDDLKEKDQITSFEYMTLCNGLKELHNKKAEYESDSDSGYEQSFIDDESIQSADSDYGNVPTHRLIIVLKQPEFRNHDLYVWIHGIALGSMFILLLVMAFYIKRR